jgi:hypothetical protein
VTVVRAGKADRWTLADFPFLIRDELESGQAERHRIERSARRASSPWFSAGTPASARAVKHMKGIYFKGNISKRGCFFQKRAKVASAAHLYSKHSPVWFEVRP